MPAIDHAQRGQFAKVEAAIVDQHISLRFDAQLGGS
jgi:hypothetical protein